MNKERTVIDFIRYIKSQSIPEIISEEYTQALSAIEEEYGNRYAAGGGLEVRLGIPDNTPDYSLLVFDDSIEPLDLMWYEVDSKEYVAAHKGEKKITPCRFIDIYGLPQDIATEKTLPQFWGKERSKKLLPAYLRLTEKLPAGALVRYVGVMDSRREDNLTRIVVYFPAWEAAYQTLSVINPSLDIEYFKKRASDFQFHTDVIVDLDLSESGVLSKIGFEIIAAPWRNPCIIDKFLSKFLEAGLCLESKKRAVLNFVNAPVPEEFSFLDSKLQYVKLNFIPGKGPEAKAYLSQSLARQKTMRTTS